MPRGRPKDKEKLISRNVTIRKRQLDYIKTKIGSDGNFSEALRKIIDLYIAIMDGNIIQELTDESIRELTQSKMTDEFSRKKMLPTKVQEYPDIFEQLAKYGRYFIPDVQSLIDLFKPVMEYYNFLDYDKLKPADYERYKLIAKQSNMFEGMGIKYNPDSVELEISAKNPYTLRWYAKVLCLAVGQFRNHFTLQKLETNMNKTLIRLKFIKGTSVTEVLNAVYRNFASAQIMVTDSESNQGIWTLLNSPFQSIIDIDYLNAYMEFRLSNQKFDLVPYAAIIEQLTTPDKKQTIENVFRLYEMLHLITQVVVKELMVSCTTLIEDLVLIMLEKTFEHLAISYKQEKRGSFLHFSFT